MKRLAVLLCVSMLFVVPAAAATTADPPVEMTVVAGYENRYLPLSPLPVSVLIESARAISGSLSVSSLRGNGGTVEHVLEIEVPAGGRKQFDLLATPSNEIKIDFRVGRKVIKSLKQNLIPLSETLVAVVARPVPSSLEGFATSAKDHPARAMTIRRSWLRMGAWGLRPLSYLVIDQETSAALTPKEIRSVIDWTSSGGRLLLAGTDPARFAWLPKGWAASLAAGAGVADEGRVRILGRTLTGTESDAGIWKAIIRPYPLRALLDPDAAHHSEAADGEFGNLLTRRSDTGLEFGWLIAFLLLYLLIVGPVNYIVLRNRGRKELLWITIPALAIAFSAAGTALSQGSREDLIVKQANVIFATPEGNLGRRISVVATARETTKKIEMDGAYLALLNPPIEFGPSGPIVKAGHGSSSRSLGDSSEIRLATDPFSGRVVGGMTPDADGYLDAELTWDGRGFFGTVTNRTPYGMSDVALLVGVEATRVGPLAAGKTTAISFVPPHPGERQVPSGMLTGQAQSLSHGFASGPYGYDMYQGHSLDSGLVAAHDRAFGVTRPLGAPMVAGFTSSLRPPLKIDGASTRPGGTSLIVSPVRFSAAPDVRGAFPSVAGRALGARRSGRGGSSFVGFGGPHGGGQIVLSAFNEHVFNASLPTGLDRSRVGGVTLRIGTDGQLGQPVAVPQPQIPGAPPQPVPAQPVPAQQAPAPAEFVVEVFDWASDTWVPFKSAVGSSAHSLPMGAVTDEGDVVLRFTSQLAFELYLWELGLQAELT